MKSFPLLVLVLEGALAQTYVRKNFFKDMGRETPGATINVNNKENFSSCTCDLTYGKCDEFCCCDLDCRSS